ncbi:MAG: hypothetical protein Tsb0032_06910 [Kiloniellaceae bacterium]
MLYVCALLVGQLSFVIDSSYLHEEQRSLFRYHRLTDPSLFTGDYLASFVSAQPQPHLYEAITYLWLWAGGDLFLLHRLIPLVSWLAFLIGVAVAARRLGGTLTMAAAVCLAAAQPLYLHQIVPATPHAFAFPLLIWGFVALLYGSRGGLAAATLLSGLLYTAVTPLLGLLLAWQVLAVENALRRPFAAGLGPLILLAVTGVLSLWLVLQSLTAPAALGQPLAPMEQTDAFPENGPEGRHFAGVFDPLFYVLGLALGQFRIPGRLLAAGILFLCVAFAAYGLLRLPRGSAPRKAFVGFALSSMVLAGVVYLLQPFHVYRYILYPVFTVVPLLTVFGLQQACRQLSRLLRFPDAAVIVILFPLALAFDSVNPEKAGYRWHLGLEPQQVLAFAADQPADSLFAIWPGSGQELEMLPYIAARPLFVLEKAHVPNFIDHLLILRGRMDALIDAYLALEVSPLRALHCRWGVDYLIVDRAHFAPGGDGPEYFAPFDARIAAIRETYRPEDFLLSAPAPAAVVLETEAYRVVELAALPGVACAVGQAD